MFYGDCMKMCEHLALNFEKSWLLHCDNTPSLTYPTHLTWQSTAFVVPKLKIKLEGYHFDTAEMIEAELQVMLNILTEHDSQDAFKKWWKRWEWCIHVEGDYFEGDGSQ
jgi:hypothetical protein